jgi:glycosyltransferase involved in cell wall biosynthesis
MSLQRLRVRGPFHGPSGHDRHTRAFVRELARQGVAVQLADFPGWGPARLPPEHLDPWFDSLDRDVGARAALHFMMPHQVVPDDGLVNVNYTMFEASHVHPTWIAHGSRHDLVIVPTESSRRAWIASGIDPGKLRVVPLGIDAERFGNTVAPRSLLTVDGRPVSSYAVRLLNVAELSARKNQAGLLRAWLRATTRDDDAVLILKVGLYSPGWQEAWRDLLASLPSATGKLPDEAAPIVVVHDLLADEQMPSLYATASHYISLSLAEGWDQPMVEAAASGLRLTAPDHSAYRAYLDDDTATLLPVHETPACFTAGGATSLLFAAASWWVPDEDAAVAAIRAAIDGQDAPRRSARDRVLRDFTWQSATRELIAVLSEAADAHSGRRTWLGLPWRRRP